MRDLDDNYDDSFHNDKNPETLYIFNPSQSKLPTYKNPIPYSSLQ
jgi:hypothetical protein